MVLRSDRGQMRVVLGVIVSGFCAFLQLYAPQPLLVLFRQTFGESEARVSLIMSAATIAVAAASPFVGILADAIGRKRVIVPCLFALTASAVGCAAARDLDQIILWRFLGGVFTPGVIVATLAYISEESPAGEAGSTTALYVTGTVVGGLTGRLAAAFAADHLSWRWSFLILAMLTLAGATGAWVLLPRSRKFQRRSHWRQSLSSLAGHLRNPGLLATYLAGFNVLFCHVGLFTYLNFHLGRPPFSLSTSALGSIFLVYALGIVVTPLSGKVVDRAGHRAAAALAVALVIGGAFLTLAMNLWLIVAGVAIASTGVFVAQAAASSHIGHAAKIAKSAASGLYVGCYYLGGSVGATALVLAWNWRGWPAIVAAVVTAQLIALVIIWEFFARGEAEHEEPLPIE